MLLPVLLPVLVLVLVLVLLLLLLVLGAAAAMLVPVLMLLPDARGQPQHSQLLVRLARNTLTMLY